MSNNNGGKHYTQDFMKEKKGRREEK